MPPSQTAPYNCFGWSLYNLFTTTYQNCNCEAFTPGEMTRPVIMELTVAFISGVKCLLNQNHQPLPLEHPLLSVPHQCPLSLHNFIGHPTFIMASYNGSTIVFCDLESC